MSDTPETDATANPLWGDAQELCLLRELARKLERERNEAREDAKRATYDAAQETIKVSTLKSHWIEACRREEKLRTALQRLADCDWVISLPDRMDAVRKIAREALQ